MRDRENVGVGAGSVATLNLIPAQYPGNTALIYA